MGKEDSAVIDLIVDILENERVINAVRNIGTTNTNVSESKPNLLPIFKKREPEDVETITKLEKENAAFRAESTSYKELKNKFEVLKKEAEKKAADLKVMENNYNTEKGNCEKMKANMKKYDVFSNALIAYEKYCSLPENLRKDSLTYINDSNLSTFIISGSSGNAIIRFHEFIRERIQSNRISDIDILKNCFDIFFSIRTETYNDLYKYQPSIGEPFNSEKQIQLKGTNLGKISEVVFYGLLDKNGNIKAKSIVISEG